MTGWLKKARTGEKEAKILVEIYARVIDGLNDGIPIRQQGLSPEDMEGMRDLFMITAKPVLYICNVSEADVSIAQNPGEHPMCDSVRELAAKEGSEVVVICGAIESEISELEAEEKAMFLDDLNLEEAGLDRLVNQAYQLLGLMTYFTVGPKEVRAWTVKVGATAPEAAGVIHTDFEKGFIRAEVIAFADFIACKGELGAKEKGKMRLEGKTYQLSDGDVMHFLFNV